jgi:hypothetical protein
VAFECLSDWLACFWVPNSDLNDGIIIYSARWEDRNDEHVRHGHLKLACAPLLPTRHITPILRGQSGREMVSQCQDSIGVLQCRLIPWREDDQWAKKMRRGSGKSALDGTMNCSFSSKCVMRHYRIAWKNIWWRV